MLHAILPFLPLLSIPSDSHPLSPSQLHSLPLSLTNSTNSTNSTPTNLTNLTTPVHPDAPVPTSEPPTPACFPAQHKELTTHGPIDIATCVPALDYLASIPYLSTIQTFGPRSVNLPFVWSRNGCNIELGTRNSTAVAEFSLAWVWKVAKGVLVDCEGRGWGGIGDLVGSLEEGGRSWYVAVFGDGDEDEEGKGGYDGDDDGSRGFYDGGFYVGGFYGGGKGVSLEDFA